MYTTPLNGFFRLITPFHSFILRNKVTNLGINVQTPNTSKTLLEARTYSSWTTQQIAAVLCLPTWEGGAGFSAQQVKVLSEAKFNGSELFSVAIRVKERKEGLARQLLRKVFKNKYRATTYESLIIWIQRLLKSEEEGHQFKVSEEMDFSDLPPSVHLAFKDFKEWTPKQIALLLSQGKSEGGAGITSLQAKLCYDAGFGIATLSYIIEETSSKNSDIVNALSKEFTNVPTNILESVVKWTQVELSPRLFELTIPSRIEQLRSLFSCGNQPINNSPSKKLVQSFGHDFEMKNVEGEVETFSESIKTLIRKLTETDKIDKQIFQSFFIASAPGTGKSRLNQELRRLSIDYLRCSDLNDQQKQYLVNSVHITTSFKNGTGYNAYFEKSPSDILIRRILFSYFSRDGCVTTNFENFKTVKQFASSIFEAISLIRTDREQTNLLKQGEPLIIYFSIDEFQDMLNSEQFLDKQVKELCTTMYSCWENTKVILIPIYSGLSWCEMYRVLRESTTGYCELPRRPIGMIGIVEIAKSVFRNNGIPEKLVFEDGLVYSYLKKTYGHPRSLEQTLEFLVKKYSSSNQLCLGDRNLLENQLKVYSAVSVATAKLIIAHTIIGTHIEYQTAFGKCTAKELDDKGVLRLEHVNAQYCRIVMSWYQLQSLVSVISSSEPLWKHFLESMDECLLNPNTDESFEKFQILFDMILNQSFAYLGHKQMSLKDRFRGFRYSTGEKEFFEKYMIKLNTFPNIYSANKLLLPKHMLHPQGGEEFFDCYGTATINNVSYLLGYQQQGTKYLGCRDFDKTVFDASLKHVKLIPDVVNEKYKSNYIALFCLNHRLTDNTSIPNRFMLCTRTLRNREIKGLEKIDSCTDITDMEVYFGSYIYNLVFS